MCGRFVSPEEAAIEREFHFGRRNSQNPFKQRFNVFPTDTIAFIRQPSNSDEPELAAGRWGLVPHWWKQAKLPHSNHIARVEDAAEKPTWRDAWTRARCLIPAEGWYEWQPVDRIDPATGEIKPAKQPHFIRRADKGLFCFAGLSSYWKNPETGEALRTCAILTTQAEGELARIHERSPLVIAESEYAAWLDRKLTDPVKVKAIASARVPATEFAHWKVSRLVNDTDRDGPELIEPVEAL